MDLYNTLTHRNEQFSAEDRPVTIYVCGITPYDTTHLGHAFTYTTADILIRYLELHNYKVKYVQNVTDIDDDILRKARETGEDWRAIGNRWTVHFIEDMESLNVRPPDEFPRATDMIVEMQEMIQELLKTGVAYESKGNVYFHIDSWPEYGKLSCLPREEMLPVANERGNHPEDPHKQDPLDFVLWQAQAPGEPSWNSPWGPGRPGWHIECSTMATHLLDKTVDIHMGGADLVFPHHESEIAQVEPVTGEKPFVRFWLHVAMVRHDGEKMSKSLGNLVMVRDLLEQYSPDALRIYLASHHYRSPWEYNEAELMLSQESVDRLAAAIKASGGQGAGFDFDIFRRAYYEAMNDDLNTPKALKVLENFAEEILHQASEGANVNQAVEALRDFAKVFGLQLAAKRPDPVVSKGWEKHKRHFTE